MELLEPQRFGKTTIIKRSFCTFGNLKVERFDIVIWIHENGMLGLRSFIPKYLILVCSCRILDSCTELMKMIKILIAAATELQRDIVAHERVGIFF